MLEKIFLEMSKALSDTPMPGIVVLLCILALIATVKLNRKDMEEQRKRADDAIRELKAELKEEREKHQKTREQHVEELRNLLNLAQAMEDARMTDVKHWGTISDTLQRMVLEIKGAVYDVGRRS